MRRLAEGDGEPLGELFVRYSRMVHSVLARNLPGASSAEVEDLVQETFITVLESAPRYEESGKLKSWLCGIAVRKARSLRRQSWLRRNLLDRFGGKRAGVAAMPESNIDSKIGARVDVTRALEVLPKAQRQVLLLHVVDNLSGEEISAALGISPKTVWTRLHRARQSMRKHVARSGDGGESRGQS
ncbi:MAG: RNA polymerase sigma factor [Myxococcota bacterium]